MNDTRHASNSELRNRTSQRDAQDVSTYGIRFNDVDAFLEDLTKDAKRGAVQDDILRLAIVTQRASVGDVYRADPERKDKGNLEYFDDRQSSYDKVLVEAAYIARGQSVKFSRICGVTTDLDGPLFARATPGQRTWADTRVRECAGAVDELVNKIQRETQGLDLDIRGGGLYIESGPWHASQSTKIESFPKSTCAHCGIEIYFANGHWRGPDKKYEIYAEGYKPNGRPGKVFDHEHAPGKKEETK